MALPFAAIAQETLPLWPNGAPGALGTEPTDIPKLYVTFPEEGQSNGGAVVICPGGGYHGLAMNHEGHKVAQWFNKQGYTAAVLQYRLPKHGYPHPAPMEDVQYAMQTMRSKSDEWKLDPNNIGVFGSSAGGHLASTAATHILEADPDSADPVRHVSSRPDFCVLLYPVISMEKGTSHGGSRHNLLGPQPSKEMEQLMSNQLQVTDQTPPTFMVHADDDHGVKVDNCIGFYQALHKQGIPAELHIFQKGGHGFGYRDEAKRSIPTHEWPNLLDDWLKNNPDRSKQGS
ncbi:MAG: alpha/beta hydrolase [Puniceicoccales bacterium]